MSVQTVPCSAETTVVSDDRKATPAVALWNSNKTPVCPGLNRAARRNRAFSVTSYGYMWCPGWDIRPS